MGHRRIRTAFALLLLAAGCRNADMRDIPPQAVRSTEMAKIILYRPSGMEGSGIQPPVYDGETLMGFVETGCRVVYYAPPGKRMILAFGPEDSKAAIDADLGAGKTYCIRVELTTGKPDSTVFGWTTVLSLVPILKTSPLWGWTGCYENQPSANRTPEEKKRLQEEHKQKWGSEDCFLESTARELAPERKDAAQKKDRKKWEEIRAYFEGPGKDEVFSLRPEDGWEEP